VNILQNNLDEFYHPIHDFNELDAVTLSVSSFWVKILVNS